MTEKEKQKKGMFYQANAPEVLKERMLRDKSDSTFSPRRAYGTSEEVVW